MFGAHCGNPEPMRACCNIRCRVLLYVGLAMWRRITAPTNAPSTEVYSQGAIGFLFLFMYVHNAFNVHCDDRVSLSFIRQLTSLLVAPLSTENCFSRDFLSRRRRAFGSRRSCLCDQNQDNPYPTAVIPPPSSHRYRALLMLRNTRMHSCRSV